MRTSRLLVVFSIALPVVLFFGPALRGGWSFSYRDAAHFYHPLFEFLRQQWAAGQIPLWNPYENLGMPLVGQSTTSMFYPGKLIFALPLDYTLLFNWYIVGHVALAAVTCYWLARRTGASVLGAGLASTSYALSGSVLFGYCNVVFLVGAAWLPLALLATERMLADRNWRAAVALGVILALLVTGGDPQMAYHAGLLAALYAVIIWRAQRTGPRKVQTNGRRSGSPITGPPARFPSTALLGVAGLTCFLLAAVQILPTWEATRGSTRAVYESPRSVWELAAALFDDEPRDPDTDTPWYAGLLGFSAEGHARQVYQFNAGPWRWIEYLWPNISGRQFPMHNRWLDVLPAEGRVWTPSLYMGLLPFVLAMAGFSLRRAAPPRVRWLSWTVVLSAVAGLGVFGGAWLVREAAGWFGRDTGGPTGDEVGGLYWLLTVVLPGYVYFRYPAKWLVVTSLALSLLAARGWDAAWECPSRRLRGWLAALLVVSTGALVAVWVFWPSWSVYLRVIPADPLFGPFEADGAWRDVVSALLQTVVVAGILLVLASPRVRSVGGQIAVAAGLLVTVVDLAVSQRWLIPLADAGVWRQEPIAVERLPSESERYRVYRDTPWLPRAWRETSQPDRLLTALQWDRGTLAPKHHLPERVAVVEAPSTIMPYDYRVFLDTARRHGAAGGAVGRLDSSVLNLVGAPRAFFSSSDGAITPRRPFDGGDMATAKRSAALPAAWIVHDVEILPLLPSNRPSLVKRRTEEVLFPGGRPRDWSASAVAETDIQLPVTPQDPKGPESCVARTIEPQRVEIETKLSAPGLVVLSDAFDSDWTLTVETDGQTRAAPILRTNRVMRGVLLPAGEHRLVYLYRPASVYRGVAISGVSLLGLAALLLIAAIRRQTPRMQSASHSER